MENLRGKTSYEFYPRFFVTTKAEREYNAYEKPKENHFKGGRQMGCFNQGCGGPDFNQKCCSPASMCCFDGTLNNVSAEPVFTQKVFDAVLFNLQGLKSVTAQKFTPNLPQGVRIRRIADIRCRKYFNPYNINDPCNLTISADVTISGGTFVEDGHGNPVTVTGPDGTQSQKIIYAETESCEERDCGTPIFGTQNVKITGNVVVDMDVVVCDCNDNECTYTLSSNVPVATASAPLILTNFFELCMPGLSETAFLPRFTEFCSMICHSRFASNNIQRDLTINPDTGEVKANLLVALCLSCEKKIVMPVQLCVLSTGYTVVPPQQSTICTTYPKLFPQTPSGENCEASLRDESLRDPECKCECEMVCRPVHPCRPPKPPKPQK